jgi:hypothetical protein
MDWDRLRDSGLVYIYPGLRIAWFEKFGTKSHEQLFVRRVLQAKKQFLQLDISGHEYSRKPSFLNTYVTEQTRREEWQERNKETVSEGLRRKKNEDYEQEKAHSALFVRDIEPQVGAVPRASRVAVSSGRTMFHVFHRKDQAPTWLPSVHLERHARRIPMKVGFMKETFC